MPALHWLHVDGRSAALKVEGEGDHAFWGKGGWRTRHLDEGVTHTLYLSRTTLKDARRTTEEACSYFFDGPYDRLLALWHEAANDIWLVLVGLTPDSRWKGEGDPEVPRWATKGKPLQTSDVIPLTVYERMLEAV